MNKMKKLSLTLLLLMGLGSMVMANNVITTNEVTIRPGGTAELIVSLENDADFNVYAYDFRLYLPEGIEVVKDGSYVYALSGRLVMLSTCSRQATVPHSLACPRQANS